MIGRGDIVMETNLPVEIVRQQNWLEPIAERLQPAIAATLDNSIGAEGAKILHGTWLGHPLHVVLTDVPLGSWTVGLVFDFLETTSGRKEFAAAADASITIGL